MPLTKEKKEKLRKAVALRKAERLRKDKIKAPNRITKLKQANV